MLREEDKGSPASVSPLLWPSKLDWIGWLGRRASVPVPSCFVSSLLRLKDVEGEETLRVWVATGFSQILSESANYSPLGKYSPLSVL